MAAYNAAMDSSQLKTTVLGGGSFGTVLASIVSNNGFPCTLWVRDPEDAEAVRTNRINSKYLPQFRLPEDMQVDSDLAGVVEGADVVMIAVPGKAVREVAKAIKDLIHDDAIIISATKGIEPGTGELMSQVISEELPNHDIGVLSGPNLAVEIAQGHLTGTVIASEHQHVCDKAQELMASRSFRIYSNEDVTGVELGGVLKNIYAILSGVASGRGDGANTVSMMMTRGLAEMCRYAQACGANPATFMGLAGIGDLIATCSSELSRNFRVGAYVGKGMTLEEAVAEIGQTAEGVNTVNVVIEQAAQMGVDMPLAQGLHQILHSGRSLEELVGELMTRDQTQDVVYKVS